MTLRSVVGLGLLVVAGATSVIAAPLARSAERVRGARQVHARTAAPATTHVPVATSASGATQRPVSAARRHAPAAAAPSAAPGAPSATTPRKLEDIPIEGEIPAPQVLFVTARDQRRFTKFHHQRYVKSALQVGEAAPLPTRVATPSSPVPPGTP